MNSQVNSQPEQVDNQSALVARLESEVEYLRGHLDKQTQLLAIAAKQNDDLISQLPPPSLLTRLKEKFPGGRA